MSQTPFSLPTLLSYSVLFSLSFAIFAYERALIPVYATVPTGRLFNKAIWAALSISSIHPWNFTLSQKALACGAILAAAPNTTYWVSVLSARYIQDPLWGPAITHSIVLVPLVLTQASFLRRSDTMAFKVALTIALPYFVLTQSREVLSRLTLLNNVSESFIFLSTSFIFTCISILGLQLPSPPSPKGLKKRKASSLTHFHTKSIYLGIFITLAPPIYPIFYSPVLPHPLPETYTHPSQPIQIHSSIQSTTGLIVVGQSLDAPQVNATEREMALSNVRYLRAAHSLLGGVWMGPKIMVIDNVAPIKDSYGNRLGDTIYGAFTLQEAARLVNSTSHEPQNALVIGLGIGVSATAFQRHKIDVTIVEIDPAVYDAARRFFGLSDPGEGRVFLEDARSWVARRRGTSLGSRQLYDIAVHDCFSGGGVPEHIFTIEFWQDLKNVMQVDGILVVNYAGYLNSDSMRMVTQTLMHTFGQCRIFHDLIHDMSQEKIETDFMNIAFFCTPSSTPITFRASNSKDYLGSPLRRHVLQGMERRELDLRSVLATIPGGKEEEFLITDAHNPLGKLQEEQGDHHWTLMREVMPDVYWETY